jgi:hypothetical protein
MKLANLTPNRGTLWITSLLHWKTNIFPRRPREKCNSLQIVKTKKKREKKMHRKEKKKILGLFYIREGPLSCLTQCHVMLRLET